jgi:hypothetical protein
MKEFMQGVITGLLVMLFIKADSIDRHLAHIDTTLNKIELIQQAQEQS